MKVEKIEYVGKADVYNMEVEETHNYVVNGGFVVHNCYDECRYVMMANPIKPRAQHKPKPLGDDPLDLRPKHDKYDFYRRW